METATENAKYLIYSKIVLRKYQKKKKLLETTVTYTKIIKIFLKIFRKQETTTLLQMFKIEI
jgi:hypothetical protein